MTRTLSPGGRYAAGAAAERKIQKQLTAQGWMVFRVAGSHTVADLVAHKALQRPLLVQCKRRGVLSPGEWNDLYTTALAVMATPVLAAGDGRMWVLDAPAVFRVPREMTLFAGGAT